MNMLITAAIVLLTNMSPSGLAIQPHPDVNRDGKVNVLDLLCVRAFLGAEVESEGGYRQDETGKHPITDAERRVRFTVYAEKDGQRIESVRYGSGSINLSTTPFGDASVFSSYPEAEAAMLHFMPHGPAGATWSIRRYEILTVWVDSR